MITILINTLTILINITIFVLNMFINVSGANSQRRCCFTERHSNVFVEDVRIARRGLDIRVVEHLLHQLEVAGVAQQLGRKIMPEIVESEIGQSRRCADATPSRVQAVLGDWTALAFHPAASRALDDVGKHENNMVAAQRPQDCPHLVGDWHRNLAATLTLALDLARLPIYLGPAQGEAFRLALAGGANEVEQWRIVVAHRRVEPLGFVFMQFADALAGLLERMLTPNRLAIKANSPRLLSATEQPAQQFGGTAVYCASSDQAAGVRHLVTTAPRDQLRNVIARDRCE
jgi:hypothetical protein